MKILCLGDIHGRLIWYDIVNKENPDLIIFLGDYVSTHEGTSTEQQLSNLEDILSYKEDNPDKVILLRGNHDCEALGYNWAECSGYDRKLHTYFKYKYNKDRFLKDTQWIYIIDNIIFSHAGVSQDWMDYYNIKSIYDINSIEPCETFGFTPKGFNDVYGTSSIQPCTWIRPIILSDCAVKGYTQIVGHTPVTKRIFNIKEQFKDSEDIWLCDALALKQYLILENKNVKVCRFDN